jgi:ribulose-phosphate 3-epimerase
MESHSLKIAPSILSADFTRLGEQIAECEAAGADWIHIDVMDGHFVPAITMGPVIVAAARRATRLPLDVHLMIEAPERHLDAFAQAGADGLTVHVEACPDLSGTLRQIRGLGKRAGVALNPDTPAGAIHPVLSDADLVLVMTVYPGASGQKFISGMLPKVRQLRADLDRRRSDSLLEVDGGVDPETGPLAAEAGATVFVAATAVFWSGRPIGDALRGLRASLTRQMTVK